MNCSFIRLLQILFLSLLLASCFDDDDDDDITISQTQTETETETDNSGGGTPNTEETNNAPVLTGFQGEVSNLVVNFSWTASDEESTTLSCSLVPQDGATAIAISDCSNTTSHQHTYTEAGTYTATLTVSDEESSTATQTTTVTVTAAAVIPVNNTPVITAFTATNSTETDFIVTFNWTITDEDSSDTQTCSIVPQSGATAIEVADCGNTTNYVHTYTASGSFTATLTVNDGNSESRSY